MAAQARWGASFLSGDLRRRDVGVGWHVQGRGSRWVSRKALIAVRLSAFIQAGPDASHCWHRVAEVIWAEADVFGDESLIENVAGTVVAPRQRKQICQPGVLGG